MKKAGTLKEMIDQLRKKLSEGKGKIDGARERALRKRIRRAQRLRRKVQRAEARLKEKAAKGGEGTKTEAAPPSA